MTNNRSAVVFPKDRKHLEQLGENILLAMKRRGVNQTLMAERSGLSRPTLRNITRGDPRVSIGHYLVVLSVLGLAEGISKVALDDELGRKLRDIELLKRHKKAEKGAQT
ncbi:MAG: helix-turn-helix transcriptional regulator [Natronospirillum sp.]